MNQPRAKLLAAVFSVLSLLPLARAADAPPPPKDAFFPIMAWDSIPGDPAVLKRLHDCGFTVAGFVAPAHLDLVRAAGMKAIVSDPRVGGYDWSHVDPPAARKNVESLVNEVKSNPAVFGYYLRDEPPASYFAGLGTVASLIQELHPGAWPYINLFPNYANNDQLAASSYDDYLAKFAAACKPPIYSYDHYALLDDGSVRGGYFENLASMRAASLQHHVPFWNIVLGNSHFSYADVSPATLRFQAYTTLAYGGKGLAYFTYFAPKSGNYRNAAVDQFGHETPTWSYLQNVNLQILKLAPTILQLTSTNVYHFDGKPLPADSLLTGAGSNQFMAGDFTHPDGSSYVLVVNKSLTHSAPAGLQLRTPAKRLMAVSPYTGDPTPFDGENIWLAPGAGALVKIER